MQAEKKSSVLQEKNPKQSSMKQKSACIALDAADPNMLTILHDGKTRLQFTWTAVLSFIMLTGT